MKIKSFYSKLSCVFTKSDKKYLTFLFIFTLVIACIETLGVSVIMPFLSVASDFSLINTNVYYKCVYDLFNFSNDKNFVISFGIIILLFYMFRAIVNSIYAFMIMKFIHGRYGLIVNKLFEKYLSLPYKDYIKYNTSSLTKVIVTEAANITELFYFTLALLSEFFIFLFIYIMLLYVNYKITLGISVMLLIVGLLVKIVISNKMKFYGVEREIHLKTFYEVLNKSFNNVKMIKLQSNVQSVKSFHDISEKYVHTKIMSGALQQYPRFIFEFVGFSLVVLIVLYYLISISAKEDDLLSLVSVFILGLYRILPSISRIFLSYNTILFIRI